MKCTKCNNPLPFGAQFCGMCGQQVVFVQGPIANSTETQATVVTQRTIGVRRQGILTAENIRYIRKHSITSFAPFNTVSRKLWEVVALNACFTWVLLVHRNAAAVAAVLVLQVALISYQFVFSRRLSWNRNDWLTVDDFIRSERNWSPWGALGILLLLVTNIVLLFQ